MGAIRMPSKDDAVRKSSQTQQATAVRGQSPHRQTFATLDSDRSHKGECVGGIEIGNDLVGAQEESLGYRNSLP